MAKKPKKNANATSRWVESIPPPTFYPKKCPTWPQVGSQDGGKMEKKSMQKSIKNLMHLGIDFWKDFGGFGEAKWSQVGTKIASKIILKFQRRFFEKTSFFLKKQWFWRFWGSKLGGKFDQNRWNMEAKIECILGSILDRFLIDFGIQVGTQNRPKRDKNRGRNGIKIWSFFEGLLERDFFGPRGAKTRQRRRSPQKMESSRGYWGRI